MVSAVAVAAVGVRVFVNSWRDIPSRRLFVSCVD